LESIYGKDCFDEFHKEPCQSTYNLDHTRRSNDETATGPLWEIRTFEALLGCVSFLTAMNKRLALYFRGQVGDEYEREEQYVSGPNKGKYGYFPSIIPALFRPDWDCFDVDGEKATIQISRYWAFLDELVPTVREICRAVGVPRPRTLETREVMWAIIQHYGLWPTPLIDITANLRVAASFALARNTDKGILYVVGMPNCTGSITFDIDQQLLLARLQSCCPPIARRPHYQDGFLVGRFPFYSPGDGENLKSNLRLRLIAKFRLIDNGSFWDPASFPKIANKVLYPSHDLLLDAFRK